MPKSVSELMEKPKILMNCRNDGGAPIEKKEEDDDDYDRNGFAERDENLVNRVRDRGGGIKSDSVIQPRRKAL
jgi:hypothetical protein